VLVIGAGPAGLVTALEGAFLGAEIHVIEKRTAISRNNILHLWPYTMEYLKDLSAKTFYPKFGTGGIDHIGTKQIQRLLLKICLLLGVRVYYGHEFTKLQSEEGGTCSVACRPPLDLGKFNLVVGADGVNSKVAQELNFKRKETFGSLSLGITLNYTNNHTRDESGIREFGLSYIFEQEFFRKLLVKHKADLENLVYYRGETHYLVMTAKKTNLIEQQIFKQIHDDITKLIHRSNIDMERLKNYLRGVATYVGIPESCALVTTPNGEPDIQVFDFSKRTMAEEAAKPIGEANSDNSSSCAYAALVGDALLEPFWPLGTGCNRAILSAQDAAWMLRRITSHESQTEILSEWNSTYLKMKNSLAGSVSKPYSKCSLNPLTRYGVGQGYHGIQ